MYCSIFAREVEPEIEKTYIDTGKVRFVWRHFPVLSAASRRAADASACAQEQRAFWEYHDALYSDFRIGGFSDTDLTAVAEKLDLDTARFSTCLADGTYSDAVSDDFKMGRSQGVYGTPTFFVNGEQLIGAHPKKVWFEIIEKKLKEAVK